MALISIDYGSVSGGSTPLENLQITTMTGEKTDDCTVWAANENFKSGYEPWRAFDGNSSTFVTTLNGGESDQTIYYCFGKIGYLENVSITARGVGTASQTTILKVYTSFDCRTWTSVAQFTFSGTSSNVKTFTDSFEKTECMFMRIDNNISSKYSCGIIDVKVNV